MGTWTILCGLVGLDRKEVGGSGYFWRGDTNYNKLY